ncbi:MAG TPA: tripartite tricarboxylate transporter substrate binding protein [Burkholderiaceae bacterium]|nr:tripartite tricarboxylate transporter substrate binding protein [Burkholderiaceae bacterium]
MKQRFIFRACLAGVLAACAAGATAAAYPEKPITLVIPFAAGGNNDISGRLIAKKMGDILGQAIVVENKTGAAGAIGAAFVAQAKPDGYTLGFLSSGPLAANMSLYKSLAYDSLKDFAPVARTTTSPSVLVANPSVPADDLKSFVDYLKKHPNKVNYGTSGNGSSPHLAAALFESMADVKMINVPYRGGSQVNTDLLGGQIQISFSPILEAVPLVQSKKLKAFAVTSATRSDLLPDVPALAESYPGYEVLTWNGIVAPAGTPADRIARLNAAAVQAVGSPDVVERLKQLGLQPAPSDSQGFGRYIEQEIKHFAKLLRLAGVEPQ